MQVPTKSEHGWAFYTPVAYFVFFFLQPILDHAGWKEWLLTGLGTIIFLILYFGILWIERKPWPLVGLGVMVLAGTLYVPFNQGATCFFIFAAALLPYIVETELGVLAVDRGDPGDRRPRRPGCSTCRVGFSFYAVGLSVVVGGTNIYFAQRTRMYSQAENGQRRRSSIWPRWRSASGLRAIFTTCWVIRCR